MHASTLVSTLAVVDVCTYARNVPAADPRLGELTHGLRGAEQPVRTKATTTTWVSRLSYRISLTGLRTGLCQPAPNPVPSQPTLGCVVRETARDSSHDHASQREKASGNIALSLIMRNWRGHGVESVPAVTSGKQRLGGTPVHPKRRPAIGNHTSAGAI